MLSVHDRDFLFRAIEANRCILFVGAGFSTDARNRLGQQLPNSIELAAALWSWLDYSGEYDGSPLGELYDAALQAGQPLSNLGNFLVDRLLATHIPSWYEIPARVFWYRIYGTNADNVMEQVFAQTKKPPSLKVINAVTDDYEDRDQFLQEIQYIKLNGSLPGRPDHLTFSMRGYAKRSAQHDTWYDHFVRDYQSHPTVFVGSEFREPLFWEAIEARQTRGRHPEERPGSFLIIPKISPPKRDILRELNITHIPATGAEFFRWLAEQYNFPDWQTTIHSIIPESAKLILSDSLTAREKATLTEFLSAFPPVPLPVPQPSRLRNYFLGVPPHWYDIAASFDAPRDLTKKLLEALERTSTKDSLSVFGLIGPAGSGKSTILMRLAYTLRQNGRDVFFSEGSERPDVKTIIAALGGINSKTVLFVDNAHLFGPLLIDLIDTASQISRPPIIVFATQMNAFERLFKAIEHRPDSEIHQVEDLSDDEIHALIATLERYAQLGRLVDKNARERFDEFKIRARKQILVAMREATQGFGFDEIVRQEFAEIDNREAKILFLCSAVATAEFIDLTEEQWLACAECNSVEALAMLSRHLKGLLFEDEKRRIMARHAIIAELIIDRFAERSDLCEAYVRILNAIAHDIYPRHGRSTRTWRLFVRLIDHRRIYLRFAKNIELARSIFLAVDSYFQNDGHFWLQFANLELEYGDPKNARPHLAYAESLMPDHPFVLTTRAHLLLREAIDVESLERAWDLRREAEIILLTQIKTDGVKDEYPYHVYIKHMLPWVNRWISNTAEKNRELKQLYDLSQEARLYHPHSQQIQNVADSVQKTYLMLAVPSDNPGSEPS